MYSRHVLESKNKFTKVTAVLGISALMLFGGTAVMAQPPAHSSAPQAATEAERNRQLADQIAELRAQVAKLQAAVPQAAPAKKGSPTTGMKMSPPAPKGMGMGMMGDKGAMGMPAKGAMPAGKAAMGDGMGMSMEGGDEGEMGGMSSAPASAMGMCCMSDMGAMPAAGGAMTSGSGPAKGRMPRMTASTSAMPGQPGVSHLYHIGSQGFFLNHRKHITLTAAQTSAIGRLKEKAMLDRSTEQRKIDQSEQELFTLTSADQLDRAKVQARVSEIEKLRAAQRLSMIEAVVEASNLLTPDQQHALMGMAPSQK